MDSSGFRIYYTDQPQERDAGILITGHSIVGHMIIPPGVDRYTVNAYCSSNCTSIVSILANCKHHMHVATYCSVSMYSYMHSYAHIVSYTF